MVKITQLFALLAGMWWLDGCQSCDKRAIPPQLSEYEFCGGEEKLPEDKGQSCGINLQGKIAYSCDDDPESGIWKFVYACQDIDLCELGKRRASEEPCGPNGRGRLEEICANGSPQTDGEKTDSEKENEKTEQRTEQTVQAQYVKTEQCVGTLDHCKLGAPVEPQVCGINLRGKEQYQCLETPAGARITLLAPCDSRDVCPDNKVEATACGNNGSGITAKTCREGQWTPDSPCVNQDPCQDGDMRDRDDEENLFSCGLNLRGFLIQTCEEGRWGGRNGQLSEECYGDQDICLLTDLIARAECGLNGRDLQYYRCTDGIGENGKIRADYILVPDSCIPLDACPLNMEPQIVGCNYNGGTKTISCIDELVEGRRQTRLQESPCSDPGICINGMIRDRDDQGNPYGCGFNNRGIQRQTCEMGSWGVLSPCEDPDVCERGAQKTEQEECGLNNRGTLHYECRDIDEGAEQHAVWIPTLQCDDPDVCLDRTREEHACGHNQRGVEERTCEQGQWPAYGPCADLDQCPLGAEQNQQNACGLNQRGTQHYICNDIQAGDVVHAEYAPARCDDPDICIDQAAFPESCGVGDVGQCQLGLRQVICENGQWNHERNPCVGNVDPQPEVCNLLDDDCDQETDEGHDKDGDGQTHCGGDIADLCLPIENPAPITVSVRTDNEQYNPGQIVFIERTATPAEGHENDVRITAGWTDVDPLQDSDNDRCPSNDTDIRGENGTVRKETPGIHSIVGWAKDTEERYNTGIARIIVKPHPQFDEAQSQLGELSLWGAVVSGPHTLEDIDQYGFARLSPEETATHRLIRAVIGQTEGEEIAQIYFAREGADDAPLRALLYDVALSHQRYQEFQGGYAGLVFVNGREGRSIDRALTSILDEEESAEVIAYHKPAGTEVTYEGRLLLLGQGFVSCDVIFQYDHPANGQPIQICFLYNSGQDPVSQQDRGRVERFNGQFRDGYFPISARIIAEAPEIQVAKEVGNELAYHNDGNENQ